MICLWCHPELHVANPSLLFYLCEKCKKELGMPEYEFSLTPLESECFQKIVDPFTVIEIESVSCKWLLDDDTFYTPDFTHMYEVHNLRMRVKEYHNTVSGTQEDLDKFKEIVSRAKRMAALKVFL